MEYLLELDREIFLYLNNLGSESWDPLWRVITNKWYNTPLYAVLLVLFWKHFGLKGTIFTMVVVAALITCTDQLANGFKYYFERPRPCRQEGVMEYARFVADNCGRFGYFSAHAASTMALAVFTASLLKNRYPWLLPSLLIWSMTVSYSRIYLGVHYPGDVLTGLLIGSLLGYLFYRLDLLLYPKIIKEKH